MITNIATIRAATAVCLILSSVLGADNSAGGRRPKWPLKTNRVLLNDGQIDRARNLCREDRKAGTLKERILDEARYWMAKADRELHDLLPDHRVPRAFEVSTEGCPVHGKTIYQHGFYPWKLDRERPFTIICPEGGERYPSNDFEAYYRSGMTDPSLLTGPYADAGRGWSSAEGERYWFVGYACQWNWKESWVPAITTLSRAYILTGEPRYARKAIVMLDRIAEVYPGMEYCTQSRYGELMQGKYHGKILNAIWETQVLKDLAIAYDLVFPALSGEEAISLSWRSAEEIRANIEANLLEEGIDGIEKERISGNFGLHQNALVHAALVRQNGPTGELLRGIFESTGKGLRHEGLNYAFYNLIYKDGMPYESSPNYCASWLDSFVSMAGPLREAGLDLDTNPRMKRMFDAPLELICANGFTPAIGDSGDIYSRWISPRADVYEAAYRRYREPRYAWALDQMKALRDDRIDSFEKLFSDSIVKPARDDAGRYRRQPQSRLLDGYGVALLNNTLDTVAVSAYYGVRNVHSHKDCLNIELFGCGRRLSPDLGYPDQTDNFHPGIFSWTQNTISHNCLVVDRSAQQAKDAGRVVRFHESPTVHVVDIEAAQTYVQTDVYRRTLVLVDTDEHHSYLVDVFRVRGGRDHVLSLHGAEGDFSLAGADLPPPVTDGTLAGRDVSLGQLHDDPVLGKPGYTGGYKEYHGSGYSHLFNWQHLAPRGPVIGQWTFDGQGTATTPRSSSVPATSRLRVHIPHFERQELTAADAYVSPTKKIPAVFKYILVRRPGTPQGNTFVTVWEPAGETPQIDGVEAAQNPPDAGCESAVTLMVHRGTKTDTILVASRPGLMDRAGAGIRTDAAIAVCTREGDSWNRLFAAGGTRLDREGAESLRIPDTLSATVQEVDYPAGKVIVGPDASWPVRDREKEHPGRFFNPRHSSIHRVTGLRSTDDRLTLKVLDGEILTGRLRVSAYDAERRILKTSSYSPHAANLNGMHVLDPDMKHLARIASAGKGTVEFENSPGASSLAGRMNRLQGKDVWVADFGPGDEVRIEGLLYIGSNR